MAYHFEIFRNICRWVKGSTDGQKAQNSVSNQVRSTGKRNPLTPRKHGIVVSMWKWQKWFGEERGQPELHQCRRT